MMNDRTKNPAANTINGIVNQYDTDKLHDINHQTTAHGTSVLTICQMARARQGCWYFATMACQVAVATDGVEEVVDSTFTVTHTLYLNINRLTT